MDLACPGRTWSASHSELSPNPYREKESRWQTITSMYQLGLMSLSYADADDVLHYMIRI